MLRAFLAILTLVALWLSAQPAAADKRVALVIGNASYKHVAQLDNPPNDARLMADTLRATGFELVGGAALIDLDKGRLDSAIQKFGDQIAGADVALFYYAGHGVQVRGSNYLVPTGANPVKEADVDFQLIDIAVVFRQMEGSQTRLKLVILDSCRNNPFGGRGLRSTTGGLAQMNAPEGTIISYATQPGNVSLDGDGDGSPYTKALAETIKTPGLGIFEVFNQVGLLVKRSTGGDQQPWVSASPIDGSFYFVAPPSLTDGVSRKRMSEAAEAWSVVKDSMNADVLEKFARAFSDTIYADVAHSRLRELGRLAPVTVKTEPIKPTEPKLSAEKLAAFGTIRPEASSLSGAEAPRQRALLYDEDPSNPKGISYSGTVVWRLEPVRSKDSSEMAVRADVEVPDRKFKMSLLLLRNKDPSLPASHTIELRFNKPELSGGGVAKVPGVLLKSNETARGAPLAGVAVEVTRGFFLVGLSDVNADRARNIKMLRERTWFDVPLIYANGRRAILAIEKGASGESAFNDRLTAWQQ